MIKHTEEFKQEAVRIALTSGLPRDRVASDLGIGKSTLGKWLAQYRPSDLVAAPQADLARENERLRLENRVLREEREVLKKATQFFREPKAVKFAFVHSWRHRWPVELLCRVMNVSERGYRSWRSRPISRRERTDMKVLAHIREQYRLSLARKIQPIVGSRARIAELGPCQARRITPCVGQGFGLTEVCGLKGRV